MLPAIGQGAIGIECRDSDQHTLSLIQCLHDEKTATRVTAERAMNFTLEGGCQAPIGGHAKIKNNSLRLHGLVAEPNGSTILIEQLEGPIEDAANIGKTVANNLLNAGAKQILDKLYNRHE